MRVNIEERRVSTTNTNNQQNQLTSSMGSLLTATVLSVEHLLNVDFLEITSNCAKRQFPVDVLVLVLPCFY